MAMATMAIRIGSTSALRTCSVVATTNVTCLCSSFSGLSLKSWQKSKQGADLNLSISSAPANVATAPRRVVLVVSKLKMKTHKASAKRFKVTASGKIMRRQAGKQHLLRKKNSKRKRRLSKLVQVTRADYDNVIGALPYLKVKGRVA